MRRWRPQWYDSKVSLRQVLFVAVLVGLSACVRAGYEGQRGPVTVFDSAAPERGVDAPRDQAIDVSQDQQAVDAPRDQAADLAKDLPPAVDGVISDLDWARCSDPSNWTCTEDSTGQCDADCHGAFWTWCKGGVVCGCGGLGQGLSYIQKSTTDCATCLVTGPACVAYYAGLP